tara:strand:- start:541 stop:1356 length:816 start_codon:yes stop_codon:yes gene_type:complete
MSTDSKITLGIPFHLKSNVNHLKSSIDSILNQSFLPSTIHLIQDGPVNDEISELINKYEKDHPKIIKILILPKLGLPCALNESIKLCNTKYYARMDADDIAFKNRLKEQINFLEKNEDVQILGSWAIEFESNPQTEIGFINKRPNDKVKINEYFHYMNPLIHSTVIFRIDVFNEIGLYNPMFFTDQDLELWGRALKKRIIISNIQSPLLYLRIEGRQGRRSQLSAIKRQIIARYSYNTFSLKLNFLKFSAIIFRFLPSFVRGWGYKNLRNN